MTVGWLIDAGVFPAYHDEFVDAVRRCGHDVVSVGRPDPPYNWDDVDSAYRKAFPRGACVVTHADIDLVHRVASDNLWTPGVFATVPHFHCSHYYAHFGKYLLNRDYVMLPFGELPRCRDLLFDRPGRDDQLFVRPDSPLKTFTGQVISRQSFEKDFEYLGFYEFPIESLIVVSAPQSITDEWRFVIADGDVITGSHYLSGGEQLRQPASDPNAEQLAKAVAGSGFQPDRVWVLDICRTVDGEYHLLEIGAFSFADLYGCDKHAVITAVSTVAQEIHASH